MGTQWDRERKKRGEERRGGEGRGGKRRGWEGRGREERREKQRKEKISLHHCQSHPLNTAVIHSLMAGSQWSSKSPGISVSIGTGSLIIPKCHLANGLASGLGSFGGKIRGKYL
jgi:hypothetical protein